MVDYQDFAAKALRDETLTRSECQAVLDTPDEQLLGLLQAAFTVRSHYFGKTVRLQMLQNAKSGACQEDCHYCSQSAISTAPIERYSLVPQQQMIDGARQAAASKAQRYCIVISGRSPLDREIDEIAGAVRSIKQEIPIQICCSLGLMNEQQAKRLKAAGVDRVNHNLNTSEAFHASICTTHTFQDRLSTIRSARAAGLEICSGGIVGMGEKDEDLIDLAMALTRREAGFDSAKHAASRCRHAARELRQPDSATLLESPLPLPFPPSTYRNPHRRRPRTQSTQSPAVGALSSRLRLRERLPHDTRPASPRGLGHDRRSRLQDRSGLPATG